MIQFAKRYGVRIAISLILLALLSGGINLYSIHRREYRIGRMVESAGGTATYRYRGPRWLPLSIQEGGSKLWDRVESIELSGKSVPADLLAELKSLKVLLSLHLSNSNITDTELPLLLDLNRLLILQLDETQTSLEGRAMLRKALPRCKITPSP